MSVDAVLLKELVRLMEMLREDGEEVEYWEVLEWWNECEEDE